jgi:hypothetical protein
MKFIRNTMIIARSTAAAVDSIPTGIIIPSHLPPPALLIRHDQQQHLELLIISSNRTVSFAKIHYYTILLLWSFLFQLLLLYHR